MATYFDEPIFKDSSANTSSNFGNITAPNNWANGNDSASSYFGSTNPSAAAGTSWWDKMMGSKQAGQGWMTPALGAAQAGLGFYLGKEQLDLAKDSLATQKDQFNQQFGVQKQQVNRDIRDQGQRRWDRNQMNNLSPEAYYEQNKIV